MYNTHIIPYLQASYQLIRLLPQFPFNCSSNALLFVHRNKSYKTEQIAITCKIKEHSQRDPFLLPVFFIIYGILPFITCKTQAAAGIYLS